MKRREFITLLGGAAAAWPVGAWAQQRERVRRIGVLTNIASDDAESQSRNAAFVQGLQKLDWEVGRNVRIDYRWTLGNAERMRDYAAELVALAPDVLLAVGAEVVATLQRTTGTIPIVFVLVPDPVGAGVVDSLSRPGGNITGFTSYEYGISGKWLELLKAVAPHVTRVAIIRDAASTAGTAQFASIQAVAPSLSVDVSPIGVREVGELERAMATFARTPNSGLVVTGSALAAVHHRLIVALAAEHRLPAAYTQRFYVTAGGLISYGPDFLDQYRRAAGYVDRIFKGEKSAELPVQAPTTYETVINLKTAKALGLTVPFPLLARADEVIE